ncbi:MAG: CotH kinase family protein, partial [Bacteroidota bacterium]
ESATEGTLVEVLLNNDYQGVYMLTERIDRKQLKLKKFKEGKENGYLYKAAGWGESVTFKGYLEFDPNKPSQIGWEQKFPDPEDEGIFWEPLDALTRFVAESSDADFKANIEKYVQLENIINYYLFLNLLRGDDNTGKNVYLAKYKASEPFFMVPWDLDATWGLFWNQNRVDANAILSNGLFDRLIETDAANFNARLKEQWQYTRTHFFTKEKLFAHFQKYAVEMEKSGAFQRERERWQVENTLAEETDYIEVWIGRRLVVLDNYFLSL